MSYHGDIALGNTIDFKFTTRQSTGAPTTLAGTPALAAYVGNSTTEITAGITLTADFDSRTGLNHVRVVATSGNGFATATDIDIVITTGTVNSVSVVGEVVGSFSIENRSALRPATAGRTLVVDAAGLADANMVKAGASGSGNTVTTSGGVTLPAGTVASTTNVTAASGVALTAAYDSAKTAAQAGDAMALTGGERTTLAGVIWATVMTGTTTAIQAMRGFLAVMLGKASGLDTNAPAYRNIADTKNVISATTDANGNRTAVTLDLT